MASLTLWSQCGGQYHLDLMPWYWKLTVPVAAAYAFTRLTMNWASSAPVKRTIAIWLLALAALIVGAGTLTYYYHLYEPQDGDENTDETTVTRFSRSEQRPLRHRAQSNAAGQLRRDVLLARSVGKL